LVADWDFVRPGGEIERDFYRGLAPGKESNPESAVAAAVHNYFQRPCSPSGQPTKRVGDHEPRSASSNVPTEYQFTANRPRRVSRARLGWRGEFREYRRQERSRRRRGRSTV